MHRWRCGTSCSSISFVAVCSSSSPLLHPYQGVQQHVHYNLFLICEVKHWMLISKTYRFPCYSVVGTSVPRLYSLHKGIVLFTAKTPGCEIKKTKVVCKYLNTFLQLGHGKITLFIVDTPRHSRDKKQKEHGKHENQQIWTKFIKAKEQLISRCPSRKHEAIFCWNVIALLKRKRRIQYCDSQYLHIAFLKWWKGKFFIKSECRFSHKWARFVAW